MGLFRKKDKGSKQSPLINVSNWAASTSENSVQGYFDEVWKISDVNYVSETLQLQELVEDCRNAFASLFGVLPDDTEEGENKTKQSKGNK